ncbi:MAG: phosphonate C-P lyase system protein PhnL [Pseudomonadota bacterium]|nr:phosphonate C-P lyase system protein PhnL [Pseudomonadota bacterium]
MLSVSKLEKSFHLYQQNNAHISVLSGASFDVAAGECVALTGRSGCGKSSLMRMIYGNYRAEAGSIMIGDTDLLTATPREVMAIRRCVVGYVSQFLRVLPRIPTIKVVAEPFVRAGGGETEAEQRAGELLARLRIPENLWSLSPLTFSGGEQQRVNIARGFVYPYRLLLLDEPTASLDPRNRRTVVELIAEAKLRGAAMVGIFHDVDVRREAADREVDVSKFNRV